MKLKKLKILSFLSLVFLLFTGSSWSQNNYNYQSARYAQRDLKKLVAPISLYPDPLVAQILPASTYPSQIADAARVIQSEKDFSKIDSQNWDASVKAVAHYPQVLKMMNDRMDWTQQLGQAVLYQQQDVLKAVQDLRIQAQNVGNLKSTPQQKVRQSGGFVEIIPADPTLLYVPVYDPEIVYVEPAVVTFAPPVSFGLSFSIGGGFFTGFYWPAYSLVYADPYYWGPYYWGPSYWWSWGWHPTNIINFSLSRLNITNVSRSYFTLNEKNFNHFKWNHEDHRGNFMNGKFFSPNEFPKGNPSTINIAERPKQSLPSPENKMGEWKNREMNPNQPSGKGVTPHSNRPEMKAQGGVPTSLVPSQLENKRGPQRATIEHAPGTQGQEKKTEPSGGSQSLGGNRGEGGHGSHR